MPDSKSSHAQPREFPATRWSVVLAARRDSATSAAAAMEVICHAYWYPLYAYVRRSGYSPHDAQDLTQGFFARLLEKRWLDSADPEKGKLRTFLIVALKRYLANEADRVAAKKRGGNLVHVPLDTAFAESRYSAEASSDLQPDQIYDRQWALTLLDLTLERLRKELAAAGRANDYEVMKDCLVADRGSIDYATLASALGASEGAARVAVHRLRKRFREIYRDEISQTIAGDSDLERELQHLASALVPQ